MAETEQFEQQEFTQFDSQNGQYDETAAFSQQMECQDASGAGSGDNKNGEGNDADEDDRKLFVGGLSWETTAKDLKEYFTKYGEVTSSTLKTDLESKRSRGFGFVVFKDLEVVEKVLAEKEHKLHGRNIDPKRANPRTGGKKVFVGKLDPSIKEDEIKAYFETFGKVEKIDLPYDKAKEQRRAFCFVEFEAEEGVKKVLDCKCHKITETASELDIRRATPSSGRGGRGRGGYGGGWGQGGWGQGYNNYYNNNYNNGYGGGGYGYGGYGSGGYGGYGGGGYYDYNNGGWGGYDQGNYGYGGGYGGYDYGGWGYGQDQGQQSSYGKAPPKRGGGSYHPYNRS